MTGASANGTAQRTGALARAGGSARRRRRLKVPRTSSSGARRRRRCGTLPFELLAHVYHAAALMGGGAKATANALEAAEKAVTLDARRAAAGELMAVLLARGDGGDADAARRV